LKILVTGAIGFIGFHLTKRLLEAKVEVIGIDNINDYYDTVLKMDRLSILEKFKGFNFIKMDLVDTSEINNLFEKEGFHTVIHLAAQAGVRYSLENPKSYIDSNIVGFTNILEACRKFKIKHLIYASSSSVYGANTKLPFSEYDNVNHPVSLYAATKKSNELMAHTYSHLYNLPTTGLRFFTVYGPMGRPDMAYYSFTKKIIEGKTIKVFNDGLMRRDFTYIDDIVEGIVRILDRIPQPNPDWDVNLLDPSSSYAPYEIYNIGNNQSIELKYFISILENLIGRKAKIEYLPMQNGDVVATYADIDKLHRAIGFKPRTTIEEGLKKFVCWYKNYHKIN